MGARPVIIALTTRRFIADTSGRALNPDDLFLTGGAYGVPGGLDQGFDGAFVVPQDDAVTT